MALPDFFVAGAPKAGSTALHAALARHPSLFMSAVKEPKFFLTHGPPPDKGGPGDARTYREHVWRRADYEALFAPATAGQLRGESTPFYLYDRAAQARIKALLPDAKLIAILRDPIERAHSNWTHLWSAGLDPVDDFVRACAEEPRRIEAGWADFGTTPRWAGTASSSSTCTSCSREQVHVLRYRTLLEQPTAVLDGICAFLGVPRGVVIDVPRENVTAHPPLTLRHRALRRGAAAAHKVPGRAGVAAADVLERRLQRDAPPRQPLTWEQRQALIPVFEPDIRLLERITGESFGDWLAPRGDSGGLVGARPSGQSQARNGQPRAY
jgi:hypothetical protein